MVRATRTSTAGTRRSASAVPILSPVQSSPKRRRKTIPSPLPDDSDSDDSDTSIMTAITTKSTVASTLPSRAPSRRSVSKAAAGRPSSTRQSTRRTTRNTLTTAEIQPENTKHSRNKLTPAPSEASTRSVTPNMGKIEPAPLVKPEPESPQENSDKENQVPLLAVPSLLGSVKKSGQQQHTPPPEYISPRKLDISRLTATDTSMVREGPRNRIVITHLVLNNFKSYAGRQLIGPFHTVTSYLVDIDCSRSRLLLDLMDPGNRMLLIHCYSYLDFERVKCDRGRFLP